MGRAEPDVTASPFVVLSGDGLVLRCLRRRDVPALLAGEDDDQVRWLLEGHRSRPERTREWVGETQREWATGGPRRHLGVVDGETGELVGAVEAHLELDHGGTNVSYVVFLQWRGRRIAARAVGLLRGWLADATPTRTAVLRIDPRNAPPGRRTRRGVRPDHPCSRGGRRRRAARPVRAPAALKGSAERLRPWASTSSVLRVVHWSAWITAVTVPIDDVAEAERSYGRRIGLPVRGSDRLRVRPSLPELGRSRLELTR